MDDTFVYSLELISECGFVLVRGLALHGRLTTRAIYCSGRGCADISCKTLIIVGIVGLFVISEGVIFDSLLLTRSPRGLSSRRFSSWLFSLGAEAVELLGHSWGQLTTFGQFLLAFLQLFGYFHLRVSLAIEEYVSLGTLRVSSVKGISILDEV